MTDIAGVELQRARWRRALRREALDTTARDDFAVTGLASRLRSPSVQLLLLPADPEADVIRIDDDLWVWTKNFQVVNVDGRNVRLGTQDVPTAHAAAMVDSYGSREGWNSYVAIHRSGALECGLGERGAWERKDREDNLVRVFNLISVVARTWALLKFGSALRERTPIDGPFQLTVGVHRTRDAFLGNVAEGWAEPLSWENELPACRGEHLLWHLEMAEWPDDEAIQEIAFGVGDRLEDAWGVPQRRYLARTGALAGRFDTRQLRD
jgi:hypothetical protein